MATVEDRVRGAILGGALGDAIGLYTEFMSASEAQYIYGSNPTFSLVPSNRSQVRPRHRDSFREKFGLGCWTDDTDQALLILFGYLRSGGREFNSFDFAKRLKGWCDHGLACLGTPSTDIGVTTFSVVNDPGYLRSEISPKEVARRHWESGDRRNAANGAVMRTSFLGAMLYASTANQTPQERGKRVHEVAKRYADTTHADPRCTISAILVTSLVLAVIRDEIKTEKDLDYHIDANVRHFCASSANDPPLDIMELRRHTRAQSLTDLSLDEPGKIGYTYKCLGAAIYPLRRALTKDIATFESLITGLTMQGGDADTNCQPAGALIGAFYGAEALPKHWFLGLAHGHWLQRKIDALLYLQGLKVYLPSDDLDTALSPV